MPRVVNKSSRAYIIGGVTLLPHVPADIDDHFMKNARVKELMEEGNLEQAETEPVDARREA